MKKILTLIGILIVEVGLLHYGDVITSGWIQYLTYAILIVVSVAALIIKVDSHKNIAPLFRRLLTNELYSPSGAVFILFTLINVGWFQDTLREDLSSFPLVFFPALLAFSLMLGKKKSTSRSDPRVLITGLAVSPEKHKDEKEIDATKYWGKWEPIRALLTRYEDIDKIIVIGDNANEKSLDRLEELRKGLLKEKFQSTELVKVDVYDYKNIFDAVSTKIDNVKGDRYLDEHILFNMTSGTAMITLAFGFHAVKAGRHSVYHDQDESTSTEQNQNEFELSLNEIKTELKTWLDEHDYD